MSIWEYLDPVKEADIIRSALVTRECPFCMTLLEVLKNKRLGVEEEVGKQQSVQYDDDFEITLSVGVCSVCGWWRASKRFFGRVSIITEDRTEGAAARLRDIEVQDISAPIAGSEGLPRSPL